MEDFGGNQCHEIQVKKTGFHFVHIAFMYECYFRTQCHLIRTLKHAQKFRTPALRCLPVLQSSVSHGKPFTLSPLCFKQVFYPEFDVINFY